MAISIHRKGLDGTEFFSRPLVKNVEDLKEDILKALKEDIGNNIKKQKDKK